MHLLLPLFVLFVFIGRFTVPGHGLTGWPGTYEAIAHIVVGILICAAWMSCYWRRFALWSLTLLTALELLMFFSR